MYANSVGGSFLIGSFAPRADTLPVSLLRARIGFQLASVHSIFELSAMIGASVLGDEGGGSAKLRNKQFRQR